MPPRLDSHAWSMATCNASTSLVLLMYYTESLSLGNAITACCCIDLCKFLAEVLHGDFSLDLTLHHLFEAIGFYLVTTDGTGLQELAYMFLLLQTIHFPLVFLALRNTSWVHSTRGNGTVVALWPIRTRYQVSKMCYLVFWAIVAPVRGGYTFAKSVISCAAGERDCLALATFAVVFCLLDFMWT